MVEKKLICTVCSEQYPANAKFCLKDGPSLKPLEESVAPEERKLCKKCGKYYPKESKFCMEDGTLLTELQPLTEGRKYCPKCGANYPKESKFCMEDGTPLKELKTEGVVNSFIPTFTAEERKYCQKCGKDYPKETKFCEDDGAGLELQPINEVKKGDKNNGQEDKNDGQEDMEICEEEVQHNQNKMAQKQVDNHQTSFGSNANDSSNAQYALSFPNANTQGISENTKCKNQHIDNDTEIAEEKPSEEGQNSKIVGKEENKSENDSKTLLQTAEESELSNTQGISENTKVDNQHIDNDTEMAEEKPSEEGQNSKIVGKEENKSENDSKTLLQTAEESELSKLKEERNQIETPTLFQSKETNEHPVKKEKQATENDYTKAKQNGSNAQVKNENTFNIQVSDEKTNLSEKTSSESSGQLSDGRNNTENEKGKREQNEAKVNQSKEKPTKEKDSKEKEEQKEKKQDNQAGGKEQSKKQDPLTKDQNGVKEG
ncbi:myb-like protein X [Clytia hemisphaerica]|uniref:myb-like protein X n=1 Tax=Clytia hemisphaerica TaxID=252671 RepID=UPI0034D678BB